MSYIQIEIGGKLRGLKFNQMSDVEYQIKVGKSTNPIAHTYALIWAGLIANCFIKGIELTKTEIVDGKEIELAATFEDVCEWCATVKDEDFLKVKDAYFSTKAFLKDIPDDVKKKALKSVPKNTKRNALK